jgi:hypothetical protein
MKRQPDASEGAAILRTWVWGADVHSTLITVGSRVELRVERDGMVIRRGAFSNVRRALETAQEWRVEYDLQRTQRGDPFDAAVQCPECRDDVSMAVRAGDAHRLQCPTCGHAWTLDQTD